MHVCWFVGSFISSLVCYACCNFSISTTLTTMIFMKFGTYVKNHESKSLLTVERSVSTFKVITAILKIFIS